MAVAVPLAVDSNTEAPKIGGTAAPPDTPATISPDPLLVCRPIPLIPKATIVGKHTLSKKSVRLSIAIPVFCFWVVAAELKTITRVR
ncbi:MAG: hypothetical protein LQ338_000855 [Usnochroma carphineum]|nr:MAG: hypothetical protein LQ338_000855 [Usnochroma carphineum]